MKKVYTLIGTSLFIVAGSYARISLQSEKLPHQLEPKVLTRYAKDHKVDQSEITRHERELVRYLELAATSSYPLPMFSKTVDDLWHTFILFTKDYAKIPSVNSYIIHLIQQKMPTQPLKNYIGKKHLS